MSRRFSHSPLKQWEQQTQQDDIGLLTLYKMYTEAPPHLRNQLVHRLPQIQPAITKKLKIERSQNDAESQVRIFSHRTMVNKRRQFQPNFKRKKTDQGSKKSNQKSVAMKEYNFGQTTEEQSKQKWVRDNIYRQFIVFEGSYQRQEPKINKEASARPRHENKPQRYRTTRISTQTHQADKRRFISLKTQSQEYQLNGQTIDQPLAQKANQLRNNPFCLKRRKLNFTKQPRKQLEKGRGERANEEGAEIEAYNSNLLSTSLQNMPCSVLNEFSPRGDRLKDMIRKYLKQKEGRPFSKKVTILQSI